MRSETVNDYLARGGTITPVPFVDPETPDQAIYPVGRSFYVPITDCGWSGGTWVLPHTE